MSTRVGNKYGVTCEGNVCTTQDGEKFIYNESEGKVVTDSGSFDIKDSPAGMTNPIDLSEFGSQFKGYIDFPED